MSLPLQLLTHSQQIADLQLQVSSVISGSGLAPGEVEVPMRALGARGTGGDDTAAFVLAGSIGGAYRVDPGVYGLSATVPLPIRYTKFRGVNWGSIIRALSPGFHAFYVQASDIQFEGLQLQGGSVALTPVAPGISGSFAIYTDQSKPCARGRVLNCLISGPDATTGFSNGIKLDAGMTYWDIGGSHFERLIGNSGNGYGYGVLMGAALSGRIHHNVFVGNKTTLVPQGRHAVYTSSGACWNTIDSNLVQDFNSSSFPVYATAVESPCKSNLLALNEVRGQGFSTDGTAAFEITGNVRDNAIVKNIIEDCERDGIIFTDAAQLGLNQNNSAVGNQMVRIGIEGIDIRGAKNTFVDLNTFKDCSYSSPGTFACISVRAYVGPPNSAADGTVIGDGNVATASVLASPTHRALVRLDPTVPAPTNTAIPNANQNGSIPGPAGVVDVNAVPYSWRPGGPQQSLSGENRASNNSVALSSLDSTGLLDVVLARLTAANQIDYGDGQNVGVFVRSGAGFVRPVINSIVSSTFTDAVVQLNLISGNYTVEISSGDVVMRDNAGATVFRSGTAGIGFFGHVQSGQLSTLTGKKDGSDGNLLCQQIADLCKTFGLTTNNGT